MKIDLEPSSDALMTTSLSSNVVNWLKKKFHLIHSNPMGIVKVNIQTSLPSQSYNVPKTRVTYVLDSDDNIVASFYSLPSGVVRLYAPQHEIEILYDGSRVKLQVSYNSVIQFIKY